MTSRERFHACMNYQPVDQVPNHEVGPWVQMKERWRAIGTARPGLECGVNSDDIFINEDMSMQNAPLLGPDTYRPFILPHMKRLVPNFRSAGRAVGFRRYGRQR